MTEEVMNPTEQPTAEEVQQHYDAAMDSVNLLNAGKPEDMSDEDWTDCVARNVEHLKIMVAKDWWEASHDTAVFQTAIDAND